MKKRITGLVFTLILVINTMIPVMAKLSEDDFAIVSAYAMDGELYMFAQLDDKYTGSKLDTKIMIDGISIANETSPQAIGESNATIKYLLMIDQSGSMKKYVDKVNTFIDSLADHEKANAVFTIAGFGEDFTIISEGITDKGTVKSAIAGLSYNKLWTDPYRAIVKALNYVDTVSRTGGEVLNIIVVSDGKVDLGIGDTAEAEETEKERAVAAKNKIRRSPEVLVHTFGVTEWDERCLDTYEAGRGDHAVIQDENNARAYGEKIANYIDGLYFLDFTLKKDVTTKRFAVDVQATGKDIDGNPAIMNVSFDKIPNLTNYVVEESDEDIFKIIGNVEEGKEKDSGELEADPENEEEKGEKDEHVDTLKNTFYDDGDPADAKVPQPFNMMFAVIAAVIIICLLAAVLLVRLAVGKNARRAEKTSIPDAGVSIWLDPIVGEIKKPKGRFRISDSMVIGSSSSSDIVLKADGVCSGHAKLYVSGGAVYIQDISESTGVFMSGIRLQAPNRLEDGDEITLGSAKIVVRMRLE